MSVTVCVGVQGPQGIPGPSGSAIGSVTAVVASTLLTLAQASTLFNNTGAQGEVDLSLPAAPSPFTPFSFSMFVTTAQTFSFVAPSGVTIQNGSDSSSPGGSISSNVVGNFVTISCVSSTLWIVTNVTGLWNLA